MQYSLLRAPGDVSRTRALVERTDEHKERTHSLNELTRALIKRIDAENERTDEYKERTRAENERTRAYK